MRHMPRTVSHAGVSDASGINAGLTATRLREVFVGFSLFLVLGTAALSQAVGLSMALGAFLAGVMLAESEYRYELELDIDPFKGLLLGLFFMAIVLFASGGRAIRPPRCIPPRGVEPLSSG